MGEMIQLTAADGFTFGAYKASPAGKPIGGLVVVQEIFGVNGHIRRVADGYAADGFEVIAPALFDRVERNVELGYEGAERQKGIDLRAKCKTEDALADIAAARDALASAGQTAIVGYCWGGHLSWLAATRLGGFAAASVYYGGNIGAVAAETPQCPVIGHFGERDAHIPVADAQKLADLHPGQAEVFIYPADHGFNCDARVSYDAASAKLARERTLAFFMKHMG